MFLTSGLREGQDIKLVFSGLRPGEKLYEELLTDKENLKPSHNELIFIAEKEVFSKVKQEQILSLIDSAAKGEIATALVKKMKTIVPEFKSMNSTYQTLDH